MKTLLRFLLTAVAGTGLLALATQAQAQTFPNSTLDAWVTRNNIETPVNWQTIDTEIAAQVPVPVPPTVTKTAVARNGPFAAQLATQNLLGVVTLPGTMILGNSPKGGGDIPGGLPFTARPAALQFYYQLSGPRAVADSAYMAVELTRLVNGNVEVVAEGEHYFRALAGTYTLVTVPLRYRSSLAPDSVSMGFISGAADNITAGTILRIDDIAFTGTATATRNAVLNAAFSAAPNPSPDGHYLLQGLAPALLAAPLTVLDATGRVVRREPASAPAAAGTARALDLSALPAGIYTAQLFTTDGLVTRKLAR